MHRGGHVRQLELGGLEGPNGPAKLLAACYIAPCKVQGIAGPANAACANVDPAPSHCKPLKASSQSKECLRVAWSLYEAGKGPCCRPEQA